MRSFYLSPFFVAFYQGWGSPIRSQPSPMSSRLKALVNTLKMSDSDEDSSDASAADKPVAAAPQRRPSVSPEMSQPHRRTLSSSQHHLPTTPKRGTSGSGGGRAVSNDPAEEIHIPTAKNPVAPPPKKFVKKLKVRVPAGGSEAGVPPNPSKDGGPPRRRSSVSDSAAEPPHQRAGVNQERDEHIAPSPPQDLPSKEMIVDGNEGPHAHEEQATSADACSNAHAIETEPAHEHREPAEHASPHAAAASTKLKSEEVPVDVAVAMPSYESAAFAASVDGSPKKTQQTTSVAPSDAPKPRASSIHKPFAAQRSDTDEERFEIDTDDGREHMEGYDQVGNEMDYDNSVEEDDPPPFEPPGAAGRTQLGDSVVGTAAMLGIYTRDNSDRQQRDRSRSSPRNHSPLRHGQIMVPVVRNPNAGVSMWRERMNVELAEQLAREEREVISQWRDLTFKPNINRGDVYGIASDTPFHERLSRVPRKKAASFVSKDETFKPAISARSKELAGSRAVTLAERTMKTQRLAMEAEKRRREEEMNKESEERAKRSGKKLLSAAEKERVARLANPPKGPAYVDPNTTFKPKISKYASNLRKPTEVSVKDFDALTQQQPPSELLHHPSRRASVTSHGNGNLFGGSRASTPPKSPRYEAYQAQVQASRNGSMHTANDAAGRSGGGQISRRYSIDKPPMASRSNSVNAVARQSSERPSSAFRRAPSTTSSSTSTSTSTSSSSTSTSSTTTLSSASPSGHSVSASTSASTPGLGGRRQAGRTPREVLPSTLVVFN